MTAGGGLPKAGVRLVVEQLQKALSDLNKWRQGLSAVKKETKATADATTKDTKRMAEGTREALKRNQAVYDEMGQEVTKLGGKLEDLGGNLLRITVPAKAAIGPFNAVAEGMQHLGFQTEVVKEKVEKATGTWATFMKQMARMGTLRGGLAFRMLSAFGGLGTAMAVGGFVAVKLGKAIGKMVNDIVDSIEQLEKTQAAERAFQSLSRAAGRSMDSIVKDVEKATGFTIDEYEILTRKNKQLQQGFGNISDAMLPLAGAARALGLALGEDTAGMLDTLIDAIREGDAALLESELGFRGVSEALRKKARDLDTTTDKLNENTRANVTLEAVLDDLERVIRNVGGAVVDVAGPMRNYLSTLSGILKVYRDLVAFGALDLVGVGAADLEAAETMSELLHGMALLNLQLKSAAEAGIIPIEAYNEALREYNQLRFATDPLLDLFMAGSTAPGAEDFQDWIDRSTELLTGPAPRAARVDYMGREAAQNYFEEMKKAQDLVEDYIEQWTIDLAEFIPLENARKQAERFGAILEERLGSAVRKTGSLASAEAQVVINDVDRDAQHMVGSVSDYAESRLEGFAELALNMFDYFELRAKGVADIMLPAWFDIAAPFGEFEKTQRDLMEDQTQTAEKMALRMARFLPYEDLKAFSDFVEKDLEQWATQWMHVPNELAAQADLLRRKGLHEDIVKALEDANKETKRTVTSMKRLANQALLLNQNLGDWAIASTVEHGGRTPLEQYQRHEEPLVAAMIDKQFADDFFAREGRPPNKAEWDYHWNEFWGPLEAYPGGPIAAATGAEAQRAKAALAAAGVTEYGDIFKNEWDKRKGLLGLMDTELTQQEEINKAMAEFYGHIADINALFDKPPDGEDDENGNGGLPYHVIGKEAGKEVGKAISKTIGGIPEFQGGGITASGGLAMLHANEAILPLGDPSRAAAIFAQVLNRGFRMPMGGGGVNIGSLSIPVTVSGAGAASPGAIQGAVIGAIRGRAGTELRRAARRLGQ